MQNDTFLCEEACHYPCKDAKIGSFYIFVIYDFDL